MTQCPANILAPASRPRPCALYINIAVAVPDCIADRLPDSQPGVRPHVTVVHAKVNIDQHQRLRRAFAAPATSRTLSSLTRFPLRLDGTGDFRADTPAMPVVYLRVIDPTGALARLAAGLDDEYGLPRDWKPYYPHLTLAWRDRHLDLAAGDAALDRVLANYKGFRAEWSATDLTVKTAIGTILTPRHLTWGDSHTYSIA